MTSPVRRDAGRRVSTQAGSGRREGGVDASVDSRLGLGLFVLLLFLESLCFTRLYLLYFTRGVQFRICRYEFVAPRRTEEGPATASELSRNNQLLFMGSSASKAARTFPKTSSPSSLQGVTFQPPPPPRRPPQGSPSPPAPPPPSSSSDAAASHSPSSPPNQGSGSSTASSQPGASENKTDGELVKR